MSRLLGPESYRRVPWKNGRGFTLELAADSPDWSWRLSIAEVPERARFSGYPGVDRLLLCLEGPGLRLWRLGTSQEAPREGEAARFLGEEEVEGEPLGPGVRDIGLMVRRDRWRASMRLARGGGFEIDGAVALAHVPSWARGARVSAEGASVDIPPGGTLVAAGEVAADRVEAAVACELAPARLYSR